jgi:very-short-patch-repair endonuclease
MMGPIPITTPIRTLIDVAGRLEDDRLLAAIESVFRRGIGTPDRLAARLNALRGSGRRGVRRLATLLEQRGSGRALDSLLEAKVWLLLEPSGVPRPVRQHPVVASGRTYHIDFAWPDRHVALECDGWASHSGLRSFVEDRGRLSDLTVARWRVLLVTWEHVTREPERVVRLLRAALELAA